MITPADYAVRPPVPAESNDWELVDPDGHPVVHANRFLHLVGVRGLQSHSVRTYAYDLLCAFRWLHATRRALTGLTAETLLDFIEYQRRTVPVAATTINRRLAVLQRFLVFLTGRTTAPTAGPSMTTRRFRRGRPPSAVRVRTPQRLVIPLTDQEAVTFFRTLHTARDRAITLLMWANGCRACEILNLGLGDVDFPHRSLKLLGKSCKERMLPLADKVAKVLLQYLAYERPARSATAFFVVLKGPCRGQPMTYAGLRRIFRYHRATSQILHANPHRFRHTFGANMTRCRVPLAILAKMMGHASPQTTLRYIQLNDHDVRQQYDEALQTLHPSGLLHDDSSATSY